MINYMTISCLEVEPRKAIELYLDKAGISNRAAAQTIGISEQNLSNMIKGSRKLTDSMLIRICEALGIPFQAFKYGDGLDQFIGTVEADDYPGSDDSKRPYHTPYNAQLRDNGRRDNMWFVPAKAQAGFIKGFQDRIFSHQIQRISFPLINGECFLFEIEGFSMYPDYTPGSYVVSTLIEEGLDWLRPKQAYVFQTPGGIAIKFFERYSDTEVFITAANNNYNPVRPMLREELQAVYNIEFRMDKPPRN